MKLEDKIQLLKKLRDNAMEMANKYGNNDSLRYYYLNMANTYDNAIIILSDDSYALKLSDVFGK